MMIRLSIQHNIGSFLMMILASIFIILVTVILFLFETVNTNGQKIHQAGQQEIDASSPNYTVVTPAVYVSPDSQSYTSLSFK